MAIGTVAQNDTTVWQQNLGLDQAVVNKPVPEARRLDADTDCGAPDRDVLEFGRNERQQAVW